MENDRRQTSFPTVPSSLSAGGHGTREEYATQEQPTAERYEAHSLNDITPYLGLRARLSQVWMNKWTILLLLVLARLLILVGSLHNDIDDAEAKAMKACTTVETMGSTVASMPHYLAAGTNELAAKGVTKTVDGLEEMLFMAITALEEIFVFWVNMMYGTYECLITFAVGGAAHVAVAIAEDVTQFLNKTLGQIGSDINGGVSDFQNGFNSFLKDLSSIPSIFGGSVTPPTLDLSKQIGALNNITLPSSINQGLDTLNKSIPDFQQVQNFTNTVLELPFEEVKKLLNQTLGVFTFNQSILPVPDKQKVEICSNDQGFNDFFDDLYTIVDTARKIFIAIILTAALLCCIPFALLEIRRWRTMKARAQLITSNVHEPMDVIYLVSRPITAVAGLKISRRFSSPKRQMLTRWFVAYITSPPALIVLAIALAGLFSALCQYVLLEAVAKEVPQLTYQISNLADKVVASVDNASVTWANHTNAAIIAENDKINSDVFGWVNITTSTLNNTLNSFINETTGLLQKAFGGTVLEDPIQQVFNCLIGLKVASIEKGLTWAQDNAHVTFPTFPNDTFSQGVSKAVAANNGQTGTNAAGDSPLADPGSDATDLVTEAVTDLTNKLAAGIRQEALLAGLVLLAYVAVLLMGLARVLYLYFRREKIRAEGGATYAGDIDPNSVHPADRVTPTYPMSEQTTGYTASNHPVNFPAPAYEERGANAFAAFREPRDPNPFETPFDGADEGANEKGGFGQRFRDRMAGIGRRHEGEQQQHDDGFVDPHDLEDRDYHHGITVNEKAGLHDAQ
ncbi:plasma membrane fusion protein prm1 [Thelotrema lepadinum]|nr:plasma membrane fusion protein prm1 [Thelotrema lepadinum]